MIWAFTYNRLQVPPYSVEWQIWKSNDGSSWELDQTFMNNPAGDPYPARYGGIARFVGTSKDNQYIAANQHGVWHRTSRTGLFVKEINPPNIEFWTMFALDENNIFAGGRNVADDTAVLYHWNGSTWVDLSAAIMAADSTAQAVRAIWASSPSDVWIAGNTDDYIWEALVLQWNGSNWIDRKPPDPFWYPISSLIGFGTNSDNIWICQEEEIDFIVAQWNGSAWISRQDSVLDALGEEFMYLAGRSSTDLWMSNAYSGHLAHWNGSAWEITRPFPWMDSSGIWYFGPEDTDLWGINEYRDNPNIIQANPPPLSNFNGYKITFGPDPTFMQYMLGLFSFPGGEELPIITVDIEEGYGTGFNSVYDGYNFIHPYEQNSSVIFNNSDGYDGYNFHIKKDTNLVLGKITIDVAIDGYAEPINMDPVPGTYDIGRDSTIMFRVIKET